MIHRPVQPAQGDIPAAVAPRCGRRRAAGRWILGLLLVFPWAALAAGLPTWAADAPSPPAEIVAEATYSQAPITLDGETLFVVYGIPAYPAEKRAKLIADRIRAAAADPTIPPALLRIVESEHGWGIVAGNVLLMTVTEFDSRNEGASGKIVAELYRRKIAAAISAYRDARAVGALGRNAAVALGATLVAAALLWGTRRVFRGLGARIEEKIRLRIAGLEAQSYRLIRATQISAGLRGFVTVLQAACVAAIVYAYLGLVLGLFPWSRPLSRRLGGVFLGPLASMAAAALHALPNLIFIAILTLVIWYLLKLVRLFFAGIESGGIAFASFERDWAWPTYRIVRVLVIAFAVIVAYPYIPGSESQAFKGVSIFIGIIFSLGSSSFIANLIAGYTMTYRRTFRLGERVQIGEVSGDVTEVGLMVTRLRTVKNEEVVVPNSTILGSNVVNFSTLARSRGLILHTTVGIGYETPWRQVEAMLKLAADRTPGLLKEPPPFVLLKSLGDFCVTYEINACCDTPQVMGRLYADLHRQILDVFNEYGVQIMTPAYEGDPEQPKVVPKAEWFLSPASPPESSSAGGR